MKTTLPLTKLAGLITLLLLLGFSPHVFAAAGVAQNQNDLSVNQPYGLGTVNQRLINVLVTPNASGDVVTGLSFTLTNPEQIARISIYQSSNSIADISNPATIYGTPIDNPGASVSFTGSYSFTSTGSRSFYLLIDIKPDATIGTSIDAVCTSVTTSVATYTPTAVSGDKNAVVAANLTGTKTISSAGDYTTLNAAIAALNNYGVGAGGVTFAVADGETFTQTSISYPYLLIRQTGTAANPIVFKQSGTGTKPIINCAATGSAADCIIGAVGVDYLTIDGLELRATGTTASTRFERAVFFMGTTTNGCTNNEIKNCVINAGDTYNNYRIYGIGFKSTATQASGTNSTNKIHHNAISNVDAAIDFNDQSTLTIYDEGNEIYNNTITGQFGMSVGSINVRYCNNTKIYNNTLDGAGVTTAYGGTRYGINSSNCTGTLDCYGNTVKNMSINPATTNRSLTGISLLANTVNVYNNVVANLTNSSTATGSVNLYGIELRTDNTLNPTYNVYHNSVYLNQNLENTGQTTAALANTGNSALTAINMANNIWVNNSVTGTPAKNFSFYFPNISNAKIGSGSDNNLYYPDTNIKTQTGAYTSVGAFATALINREQHSIAEMPPFISATDLHLNTSITTRVEGSGTPITEVTKDIDGDMRSASSPDLGADEGDFKAFNYAPTVDIIGNQPVLNNNASEQIIYLTGISDGNPSTVQDITITCTSSNPSLVPNPSVQYLQGSSEATLKYTPTGTGKGNVIFTVKLQDNGGTDLGGEDTKLMSFDLNILDPLLNNPPTINTLNTLTLFNDSPQQTVLLSGITDGEPLKDQNITVSVSAAPSGIISEPLLTYLPNQTSGQLSFSPLAVGTATITIKVKDDGGSGGENVDSVETSFVVNVKDVNSYAFIDKFEDGIHTAWFTAPSQYSITESDDILKVKANKNTKWTSFGVNFPAIDISENPYLYIRLKPMSAETPFKINAYIGDGTKNPNIQKRVLYGDSTYTELSFDFTGAAVDLAAIKTAFFAINGDGLAWDGTVLIDELRIGGNTMKAANLSVLRNMDCAKDATQQKAFITDIDNATSLTISNSNLIQNVTLSPILNKMSTLTFDVKPGVSGREKLTVTAIGEAGYANKSVTFWVNVNNNLPPVISTHDDVMTKVGKETTITLTGIDDGNTEVKQNLTITAVSDNPAIPTPVVEYIQEQSIAKLKLNATSAVQDAKITVTVNDGETSNNITTTSFMVDAFTELNNPPVADLTGTLDLLLTELQHKLILTGVSDGDQNLQDMVITATSSVDSVIATVIPDIEYVAGQTTATLTLNLLKIGSTVLTVTMTDKGGNANNNGDQTTTIQIKVNVLNDPILGYVVPTDVVTTGSSPNSWGFGSMYKMNVVDYGGFNNVLKIDYTNKSNWDATSFYMPEVGLKNNPYMSMDVYPETADLYWHVYLYDVDGARNEAGAHAERKLLKKGQWNSIVLDYRTDGYLLDKKTGLPINIDRVSYLMFNMHDKNFPFPFTTCSGTTYLKNIRVGDQTIFPSTNSLPTITPVLDQSMLIEVAPKEKQLILRGISDGNFSVAGVVVTAVSNNVSVANPTVDAVKQDGTAILKYTPGTTTGTAQIILSVTKDLLVKRDTFNIDIVSNDVSGAQTLTVDTLTKYQKMRGFGTYMNAYKYIDKYTTDMGASAMRIGFISNQFEPINDNNDPDVTDFSKFNQDVFDWDYLRACRDRGVEDFVLTSWSPPAWMKGNLSLDYMSAGSQTNSDLTDNKLQYYYYDEFAEMMVAFCKVFKEEMGIELTGVGLQNEPAFHEPYPSAILDPARWVQLIKIVGPRLEAEGLNTKIYGPEQVFSQGANSMANYIDAFQADPLSNKYCTVIASHSYAADGIASGSPDFSKWAAMWNNCQEGAYPKELWMTEADHGYAQFSDAMYWANAIYGSLTAGNVSHWTTWGFENTYFDAKKNVPTSALYVTRNFAKYIRPGARRVSGIVTGSTSVLGCSFINDKAHGGSMASVLINNGTVPYTIKIAGANLPAQFDIYQTTEALNCEKTGIINTNEVVLLPPQSVTTLVGSYGNHAPTIEAVNDVTIMNSSPMNQTISLTGITDGDLNEVQNLTITATSSNPALISNPTIEYIQGSETASLNYTHIGSALGFATIHVVVKDDGGVNADGKDSVSLSFKVSVVQDVNLIPTINNNSALLILEDAPAQSVLFTGISDGNPDVVQPMTIEMTCDNPALIPTSSFDYTSPNTTGTLNFTVTPDISGTAKFTITLNDHGGNVYNNGDMTKTIVYDVTVNPVNDAPLVDAIADQTSEADQLEKVIEVTGLNDGDADFNQNLIFGISATSKNTYFAYLRTEYVQGENTAKIKYKSRAATGTSTVTLNVYDDGGTENGGVDLTTISFDITLIPASGLFDVNAFKFVIKNNPAKEWALIETDMNDARLTVQDLKGNTIYEYNMTEPSHKLVTSNFTPGIYIVTLNSKNSVLHKKLIVL